MRTTRLWGRRCAIEVTGLEGLPKVPHTVPRRKNNFKGSEMQNFKLTVHAPQPFARDQALIHLVA